MAARLFNAPRREGMGYATGAERLNSPEAVSPGRLVMISTCEIPVVGRNNGIEVFDR